MRRVVVTIALSLLVALPALADGLRFANGRLDEGSVTVLDLSDEQLLQVKTKRIVVLTNAQKQKLTAEAKVAPTVLTVYSLKAAANGIDSCFEYNAALWFEPRRIEVPHRLLVSDEAAAARAEDFDNID